MSLTSAEEKLLVLQERWHEAMLRLCNAWERSKDVIVRSRTEEGCWPKEAVAEAAHRLHFEFGLVSDTAKNLLLFADRCIELGRVPQERFAIVYLFTPQGFVERFEPRECGPSPLKVWSDVYTCGPEPRMLEGPDALVPLVWHSDVSPQRLQEYLCDEISKIGDEKTAELDKRNKK